MTEGRQAYLTLALVPGIGRARIEVLLATFGSAEAVLAAAARDLEVVPGMTPAVAAAVASATREPAERALERAAGMGVTLVLPGDSQFPALLRAIPEAPALLFALGQLRLFEAPAVAIVGSRTHTRYGAEVTRHFAGGVARAGLVVVSGMARGLDAVAHAAALEAGGGTIGVLGNGHGVVYPSSNGALFDRVAREGCLVTEHPPGEPPHEGSFPRRNRLISGLAKVTLVTEARRHSGTLITVKSALEQGRDVLVVPGPITSPLSTGCNALLQQGAKPALGLRDVLEEYGLGGGEVPAATFPTNISEPERQVLDALGLGLEHVDEISRQTQRTAAEVLALLTSLEIRGLVRQDPGKIFRLETLLVDSPADD